MKVPIELNMPDTRMFLNFWNWDNGDDVVCEIKDGKLILIKYDQDGKVLEREITLQEFCEMVRTRIQAM
jgi:hypothetical protein